MCASVMSDAIRLVLDGKSIHQDAKDKCISKTELARCVTNYPKNHNYALQSNYKHSEKILDEYLFVFELFMVFHHTKPDN